MPDNEDIEATEDRPIRWFKALLAPSLLFSSEAACLRISWACALQRFWHFKCLESKDNKNQEFSAYLDNLEANARDPPLGGWPEDMVNQHLTIKAHCYTSYLTILIPLQISPQKNIPWELIIHRTLLSLLSLPGALSRTLWISKKGSGSMIEKRGKIQIFLYCAECFSKILRTSSTSSLEPKKMGDRTCNPVGWISRMGLDPSEAFPPAFSTMWAYK